MNTVIEALRHKRCFLWDFDGCLCDTERLHYLAYAQAFSEFGHRLVEAEYYPSFTHLGGGVMREILKHGLSCDPKRIAESKREHYWGLISSGPVPFFPEIPEIVDLLRKGGGKVGIASNSPLEELSLILERQSLQGSFDLIIGKRDALRKKPFPDLFLTAMESFGCSPSETLVFEDSDRGLEAAHAAGCQAVWIRTSYNAGFASAHPRLCELTHADLLRCARAAFLFPA